MVHKSLACDDLLELPVNYSSSCSSGLDKSGDTCLQHLHSIQMLGMPVPRRMAPFQELAPQARDPAGNMIGNIRSQHCSATK